MNSVKALVVLPSGIYKQKRSNGTAVYQYTRHFRNKEGKSRHKSIMIGMLDKESGMLIPNDNYYIHNNIQFPNIAFQSVQDYGYTYSFYSLSNKIGLTNILKDIFEESWDSILTTAAYILSNNTVMEYIDNWYLNTYSISSQLDGRITSTLFSKISRNDIDCFFKEWVSHFSKKDCYFYDVTSISSYSGNIDMIEYGYNRDHEDLAQINLGMFCHSVTRLPVYYNLYNGSLTDKKNLQPVIKNAKDIGIKNINLVMDGGFFDEDRIKFLDTSDYKYTLGMPSHLKKSQEIIKKYGKDINEYEYKLHRHNEYCMDLRENIYQKEKRIMLCFNETLRSDMMNGFVEKIDKLKIELEELKRYPKSKIKRYNKYFKIEEKEDGSFSYSEDIEKIKECTSTFGYFLLMSNDNDSHVEELLYYYRAKDADEKLFMAVKNYMDGKRLRTHNNATTEGKIFVIFIALIIRSEMFRRMEKYLNSHNMSLKKAIMKLNNIRTVQSNKGRRLLKSITKEQRDLLDCLELSKKIEDSITNQ